MDKSAVSITKTGISVVGNCDWGSMSDNSFGVNCRGISLNDGIESVDGIGGVGHSSDSTVGFNKGVLALN